MNKRKLEKRDKEVIDNAADNFINLWLQNGKLNLELAGILYINATLQFREGEKQYRKLELEKQKYEHAYSERSHKFDKSSESFYTYILPKLRNIELIYEPAVRYFATCKILLVCCAESFINEVAHAKLTGRHFLEFDRLSIVGKWIFIQDILKVKKKITIDRSSLQVFSSLVKERNRLDHFKGLKKDLGPWRFRIFWKI